MRDLRGATLPGTVGRANEDAFAILPDLVVVADGATSPPHLGDGCIHGPAWYSRTLVAGVTAAHADDPKALPADLLAAAITSTTRAHVDTCDIAHPGTPSATVAILAFFNGIVRWLVLGDCTLAIDAGQGLQVITDDRLSNTSKAERAAIKVPGGATAAGHRERVDALVIAQRRFRNRSNGFWVAAADPNAAYQAYLGESPCDKAHPVGQAALMTDGASRIVDTYGVLAWAQLLKSLQVAGPPELLEEVRRAEHSDHLADSFPRIKLSDDATAVYASWTPFDD